MPNSFNVKKIYLENNLDSIQVLILGSSESLFGLNPRYFRFKTFNLAAESQSLYYDKELTLKYLDRMPQLNVVIISIAYFSLWYELFAAVENWRDYFYYKYYGIKSNDKKIFDLKQISYIDLYGIDFAQNSFRKNFTIRWVGFPDENGWINPTGSNDSTPTKTYPNSMSDSAVISKMNSYKKVMKDEFFENNKSYLDTLLTVLNSKWILPVIITTPVYKTYLNYIDYDKYRIINNELNQLCKKYNCIYLNYFEDKRFNYNDFEDSDHLGPVGAKKLSKILDEKIIKIIELNTFNKNNFK